MRKILIILLGFLLVTRLAHAAEVRLGLEVEFRTFYLSRQQPNYSFQFREAKLFFDTFISEKASALLEIEFRKIDRISQLERGYFLWRQLPLNSQLKFGQFRIPFGLWDAYTIDRSLIKNSFIGQDENFQQFKLRKLDVGVEVQSSYKNFSAAVAVINGNTVNTALDDNNQKDFVARLGYSRALFSMHVNTYFGTAERIKDVTAPDIPRHRHITAVGLDFTANTGDITFSGEIVDIKYEDLHAFGAYLQFSYDLLEIVYGLRLVGKIEFWDPDKNVAENDLVQAILGFKHTLARGMTIQLEYRYHTHQIEQRNNGLMLEVELEL